MLKHSCCGEELTLLPEKAVWWEAKKTIIIADVHLGKSMHFRKSGIPLPLVSHDKDYARLVKLFETPGVEEIIFLGDLFHSEYNSDWELLGRITANYQHLKFSLIQGNHDILHHHQYRRFGFHVIDMLHHGPFLFTHEPVENPSAYNIYGHIHPGVRLEGGGRQSLRLSCFFFSDSYAVMPSFGKLTGTYALQPKKTDKIFAIGEGKIFALS